MGRQADHAAGKRKGGMSLSAHQSARMMTDEWLTPPEILAALGPFDLDPCTPDAMPWQTAAARYTKRDDGLAQPWRGRVWLNPPFGREAVRWLRKLAAHGDGVALVPARTETRAQARTQAVRTGPRARASALQARDGLRARSSTRSCTPLARRFPAATP